MKKAMTLCIAAMLTIGASATAYAAPCDLQAVVINGGQFNICDTDTLKQSLLERLEACLGIELPSFPAKPDKPETNLPVTPDKPEAEKPETPDAGDQSISAYAAKVVELVNEERAKAGLSALELDVKASQAAQVRAEELNTTFSHTRPDGRSCYTALDEAGVSYRAAGENIAKGQRTPEEVVNAWMNSAGHRKNILSEKFTAIGVGYSADGNCWTQLFIG